LAQLLHAYKYIVTEAQIQIINDSNSGRIKNNKAVFKKERP